MSKIISFFMPMKLKKRGGHTMILVPDDQSLYANTPNPDVQLIKSVVRAHLFQKELDQKKHATMKDLAEAHGVTLRYVQQLLPLASLSPTLTHAILNGTQPRHLRLADLLNKVSGIWEEQKYD